MSNRGAHQNRLLLTRPPEHPNGDALTSPDDQARLERLREIREGMKELRIEALAERIPLRTPQFAQKGIQKVAPRPHERRATSASL